MVINDDRDAGGLPLSSASRASISAVAKGRAGIKSVSPRGQVISVGDLNFLELLLLNTSAFLGFSLRWRRDILNVECCRRKAAFPPYLVSVASRCANCGKKT